MILSVSDYIATDIFQGTAVFNPTESMQSTGYSQTNFRVYTCKVDALLLTSLLTLAVHYQILITKREYKM